MANIEDYLKWRGDLRFSQDEFNEVDSLILTQLCYLDLKGIIPAWNEKASISMAKLIEKYWLKNIPAEIENDICIIKNPSLLMNRLKESRRYSELMFANYIDRVDEARQEQFSAMTVWIPDGSVYVAYSGTDTTMVGWKENFNMTYMDQVPAQLEAVNYLERVYEWTNYKIRLGGHSKGGNLAVYAAIHVREDIADKIISVHNFDGPGFRKKVIKSPEYKKAIEKVSTFLPETSIVGRFLEHSEKYTVIKSNAGGLWQHDAFSWQVEGNSFVYTRSLDLESDMVNETINLWLERMDVEERRKLINTVFDVLEQFKIETIEDFTSMNWKNVGEFLKIMSEMDENSKKEVSRLLRLLWKGAKEVISKEVNSSIVEKNEGIKQQLSEAIFGKKNEK